MLTTQDKKDIAGIVDDSFDRKFDEKFDTNFDRKFDQKFDENFDRKFDQKFDEKFDQKFDEKFKIAEDSLVARLEVIIDDRISRRLGTFIEHLNDQFDRVIEALGSKIDKNSRDIQQSLARLDSVERRTAFAEADIARHSKQLAELEKAK